MNPLKKNHFLRQNLPFYLTGFLVVFGIKYFSSRADSDHLTWLLAPIAKWVELLSGIPFQYMPGEGYANHSLRLLIAPSCSGLQFMNICIAMFIFTFVHRIASPQDPFRNADCSVSHKGNCWRLSNRTIRGFCWILLSIFLSYLLTIFVNGLRIIAAIYLPLYLENYLNRGFLTSARLHTLIGITVYFTALLTIYRLTEGLMETLWRKPETSAAAPTYSKTRTTTSVLRRCAPPVFWYFSLALGIPFLNRAYRKNLLRFTEFTISVTSCCAVILLLYFVILLTVRLVKKYLIPSSDRGTETNPAPEAAGRNTGRSA